MTCSHAAIDLPPVVMGQGNLYGTTWLGGKGNCHGYGCGVAFELIPNADGSWKEKVLHYFTGDVGVNPTDRLTFDTNGNLYGTTGDWSYSFTGPGTVFELTPNSDGSWTRLPSILSTLQMATIPAAQA